VPIAYSEATLVAAIGLVVNVVSALLLAGPQAHDHGHAHDHNFRAAYLHVLADALTSVLAIIALLAGWRLGWVWLDPTIGVVGALVIARWSWGLIRDTSAMLLDEADPDMVEEVRSALGELCTQVHDLHIWRIGPQAHCAIVSLTGNANAEEVRRRLARVREIAHLTVEVRPAGG